MAVLIGTVLTAIIQSSSVTVSIVLLMANQGLIPKEITLFIILGCNIGACTPALLSSLAGKRDAKRAAYIHLLFNIIGTVLFFVVFMVAMNPVVSVIDTVSSDAGRFVANAHTIIKIVQVIILLPFSNLPNPAGPRSPLSLRAILSFGSYPGLSPILFTRMAAPLKH
jgi:phosphate:Na+ symporter